MCAPNVESQSNKCHDYWIICACRCAVLSFFPFPSIMVLCERDTRMLRLNYDNRMWKNHRAPIDINVLLLNLCMQFQFISTRKWFQLNDQKRKRRRRELGKKISQLNSHFANYTIELAIGYTFQIVIST